MPNIGENEKNLFNAMEVLGQFYDEIEGFLNILYSNMERAGFSATGERLRSGTVTTRNLARRLLASATIFYIRGVASADEGDIEEELDDEGDETASVKRGKEEVSITPELRIPFAHVALFPPNTIPTARTLESPTLCIGALGNMSFAEKRTDEPVQPEAPVMAISNLAHIGIKPSLKRGDAIRMNIWKPARMKKFRLVGRIVEFERQKLLEVDSQDRIRELAEKLLAFGSAANPE